ncbi:MAG: DNA-directed RNA polymerase subunit alpha [Patescibacteria group bacterium]
MENILLPSTITFLPGSTPAEATLVIEPFFYGYGRTVGNALRRVLLSSLSGAAVTSVKIKGVQHEFTAVTGVLEDALQIILNLKGLRLKLHSENPVKLTLKKSGQGPATGADFEANADVEIMNPDLHIATVTDEKSEFELEVTVGRGRGYSPTEEREPSGEIGQIAIDSLFSPVRNVGFKVEPTRVGEITDYDKLIMKIETDGTITPQEAVKQSVAILLDHYNLIAEKLEAPAAE